MSLSTVGHGILSSNHKVLTSPAAVSAPKASAKVLIPAKSGESETEDVGEKSSSSAPGDILGLANYATDDDDDDEDDEIPSSGVPNYGKDVLLQLSIVRKTSNDRHELHDATANGSSPVELEENSRSRTSLQNNLSKASSFDSKYNNSAAVSDIGYDRNKSEENNVDKHLKDGTAASRLKDVVGLVKRELPMENVNDKKTAKTDPHGRESRMKPDKHESKRSYLKDNKEVESGTIRKDEKGDEKRRRQDDKPLRKERTDDRNGSKEKIKDQNVKPGEKSKESDSSKRSSHPDVEEDRRETDRLRRDSSKEDVSRKRERTKNKEDDRSRRKHSTDSSRHKRRRSSSIDSRGRISKDNPINHANHSSDESSEDSKRFIIFQLTISPSVLLMLFSVHIQLCSAGSYIPGDVTYHHHQSDLGEGTIYQRFVCLFILCFLFWGKCRPLCSSSSDL